MIDAEFQYAFTVFTPTHDRAHTLSRVYDSLRAQTCRDFEWLIVDDGSTDDTQQVIQAWQLEADFPIRYIFQEHGGKHVAYNRGVAAAAGELFLCLDSDDGCVPNALERFLYNWYAIPDAIRPTFSAVTSLVSDQFGKPVGGRFENDVTDSDSLEQYFVHRVPGEKWGFQRTRVLREFPFPTPDGVMFVSEAVVWFAIARKYKTRYINEVLRLYYQTPPSESNLSTLSPATAKGRLLFHKAVIEDYLDYLRVAPTLVAKSAVNYVRYSCLIDVGVMDQIRRIRTSKGRLLVLASLPIGVALSVRDRMRG